MTNPVNVKARNIRIESTLRHLKLMLDNCDKQENMGVPVSVREQQLYGILGAVLVELLNKEEGEFAGMAGELVEAIDAATGITGGTGPKKKGKLTQKEAGILAAHLTGVVSQMVNQGVPREQAMEAAMKMAEDIVDSGRDIKDIAKMEVKVVGMKQKTQEDQFSDFLSQLTKEVNNNTNGFPF